MSYSVVIPSRNAANLLACVGQLRKMGETCRVIVINDGLNPNTFERNNDARLLPYALLPGIKPFVYARNVNLGIRAAGRDDVVLLNDDALVKTSAGLSELAYQCIGCGFAAICPGFDSCGTPDLVNSSRFRAREVTSMLIFACCFIPRATINKVGLLDERFGINAGGRGPRGYGLEDDDYSLRIRNAGLTLGVYDGVMVDHTTLKSTFRHGDRPIDVRAHEELFKQKWGHWPEGHGYPK